MSLSINSNIAGSRTLNSLNQSNVDMNSSIQRFSTGKKINSAADDASGMMIADSLGGQARGAAQMIMNANNSINIAQIKDGALGEAGSIMQSIRDKVLQASSSALSSSDRGALGQDIAKSMESLGKLYEGTQFNGQTLLSDSPGLSSLSQIDISSVESSQASLKMVDDAMEATSKMRADVGATQNQLASTINSLGVGMVSSYQSESAIKDVDLAQESMNMKQIENLRTAGLFALAQSNAQPKNVISLLGQMAA
ncbi:MAG: hypothetical protein HQK64_09350 [Desulfamplus sp.]|nr:hypothetical protein [Desulfamplus sp.]MBF0242664.1 hypothetical protein [Desulfamplus sp.]MBF0389677.1 hypothetical protein [Desulfamplus sp.]